MTTEEFDNLEPGFYRLWEVAKIDSLLCIVGITREGRRWAICSNWSDSGMRRDGCRLVGAWTSDYAPGRIESICSMEPIKPEDLDYLNEFVDAQKKIISDLESDQGILLYTIRVLDLDTKFSYFVRIGSVGETKLFNNYKAAVEHAEQMIAQTDSDLPKNYRIEILATRFHPIRTFEGTNDSPPILSPTR